MSDADPLGLIRCDWGHKIGTEQDNRPCPKDAVRRVALHADPDDVDGSLYKFCAEHCDQVTAATDDRAGPVVERTLPEVEAAIRLGEELLEADPPAEVAAEVRELVEGLRALRVDDAQ